ncbi:MAG TPA: hypothetical protein ENJ29_09160, partial [Bacteroidetes bacterium]|nr:hypothetical protein [Bacteroidota bacterium]
RTYAMAQEPGNANDWIRVWALDTRRVLKGKITQNGSVHVGL